jgi:hypothetical protein
MTRYLTTAALVVLSAQVALAQPAPSDAPTAQPPADPAQPPVTPLPTPTPTPTPVVPAVEPPPAEPKEEKPAVTAKYDGGVKLATEDNKYEMKISFRSQMRFEANRPLDDETPARHNQFSDRFYIPRARLQAEGHLFGKDNRYKLELGMGDQGSFSFIKDMFMEKRLPDSPIYVRFGQWKRPFNRSEIVSDFGSTFNERSIQNELAGGGRDLGAALHNDYDKAPDGVEWVVGMFNGFSGSGDRPAITTTCTQNAMTMAITCVNSRPSTFPADFGPTLVARVGYNSPKSRGYTESDLDGGPLRYAVGAAYKVDLANLSQGTRDSWAENMSHGLELDANVKAMGYSVTGGVVMMKLKDADPELGFYVQPAMMVIPKKAEIAARFAMVTVTVPGAMGATIDRNQIEARAAFNYYFQGHTWKLANDAGFLMFTGDIPASDKPDLQFRVMLQMSI